MKMLSLVSSVLQQVGQKDSSSVQVGPGVDPVEMEQPAKEHHHQIRASSILNLD
jgi:hypothetical protein